MKIISDVIYIIGKNVVFENSEQILWTNVYVQRPYRVIVL